MYPARDATLRDLRHRFAEVERRLQAGGEILITRRKRVIVRRLPPEPEQGVTRPDCIARISRLMLG